MCAGAISLVRFQSVIYGCPNDKFGGNGSIIPVHELGCGGCGACATTQSEQKCDLVPKGYPYPSRGGLFAQEAIKLLQDFYTAGNPNGKFVISLWNFLHYPLISLFPCYCGPPTSLVLLLLPPCYSSKAS